jgi:hypothetical protein
VPTTPLSIAKAGDVLAHRAVTESGMLLLPAGTVLTDRHLARLADAGVHHVSLQRDGFDHHTEQLAQRGAIEERFWGHDDDPLMQALKAIVIAQLEPPAL